MQNRSAIIIIAVIMAALASCDTKKQQPYTYQPPEEEVTQADSTIFGFCGKASTREELQLITASDDTIYINVEEARKAGKVLTDYNRGDELYVLPDSSHRRALIVINKNNLLGEWVMPSSYDGSTPSGIVIKDGGEAESFNQQGDIAYKGWSICNGMLQLTETHEDGTDIFYTQTYNIVRMTKDSLYLRNINEEESFEYGRYVPEPVENLGIEFDEDDSDNYGIY